MSNYIHGVVGSERLGFRNTGEVKAVVLRNLSLSTSRVCPAQPSRQLITSRAVFFAHLHRWYLAISITVCTVTHYLVFPFDDHVWSACHTAGLVKGERLVLRYTDKTF